MDQKFFSAAQPGMPMSAQHPAANARMLLTLQQQQQQQQANNGDASLQQYGAMTGARLAGMNFNAPQGLGPMGFNQADMNMFAASDLGGMGPFMNQPNQPSLMGQMSPASGGMNSAGQITPPQQQTPQNPQLDAYSQSPNMMAFTTNPQNGGQVIPNQYQRNRAMYQTNGDLNMMQPGAPQSLLYQQQQATMSLNRAKQSPSQSPAQNSVHFQHSGVGSPVVGNSPHMAGGRLPMGYSASPPMGSLGGPMQQAQGMQNQGQGVATINRSIPSQRYMPHVGSPQNMIQNSPVNASSPRQMPRQGTPQELGQNDSGNDGHNVQGNPSPSSNFAQGLPIQGHTLSSSPRRSATPTSATSTPLQQHRQIESQQQKGQPGPDSPGASTEAQADSKILQTQEGHTASPKKESSAPATEHVPSPSTTTNDQQTSVVYVPKTRNVETYGGVDLKYFDKFDIKPLIPHVTELGAVDIRALILSLKSGLKMEVANALNIFTVLTAESTSLALAYCEDLLDVFLDYLEQDILGQRYRYDESSEIVFGRANQECLTYAELFDMSLDEMKSLIPKLEETSSDLWVSLRERCLCIFNILRNLSFMPDNIEYLAKHKRFVTVLARTADSIHYMQSEQDQNSGIGNAWFVGVRRMDTLDFRKTILIILSNIAMHLPLTHVDTAGTFVRLSQDFITFGPDTYYSFLAVELWAKIAVNYENRKMFAKFAKQESFDQLCDIWAELVSMIRRDYFLLDGKIMYNLTANQLATLEYAVMGLYNITSIMAEDVDERTHHEQLLQRDHTVPMTILRLCSTLAESGIPQFSVVTKRGMELVRVLVAGSEFGQRRRNINPDVDNNADDDDGQHEDLTTVANRLLDMALVREILMNATLRPSTDLEFLRDLSDLVSLIDGDSNKMES